MGLNPIKAWLQKNNAMGEVMQARLQETAELKERMESIREQIKEHIKEQKMIALDEMIGFPIPPEHREELMKRMSTYESMTKEELISLLLQNDCDYLQMME